MESSPLVSRKFMSSHVLYPAFQIVLLLSFNAFIFSLIWFHGPYERIPPCSEVQVFFATDLPSPWAYLVNSQPPSNLLPNLTQLNWPPTPLAPSPNPRKLYRSKFFQPRMTATQRRMMYKYLELLASIMRRNGLENKWFIEGGTLIGSLRHHDFIPWDDSADVLVDVQYRELIHDAIRNETGKGFHVVRDGFRDKIFMSILPSSLDNVDAEGSRQVRWRKYGWPYLDVHYYKIEKGLVYELENYYAYEINDVFPLIYRPFGKMWVPTPKRSVKLVLDAYPRNVDCIYDGFSHLAEWQRRRAIVSCGALSNRFAFVRRCPALVATAQGLGGSPPDLAFAIEQMIQRDEKGNYTVIHEVPILVHATERFSHFDPITL